MFRIKVADIVMDYDCYHTDFFSERLKDYITDEKPTVTLKYSMEEKIELPQHTAVKTVEDATIGKLPNGNTIMYLKTRKKGRVISYIENNPDYTYNVSKMIHLNPTEKMQLTDCDREYLRSGTMFNNRLIYEGGTTLHGSAIAYRGEGVIFSAPCGTGKSTHTTLWTKLFKDDVSYINDDKPAIRFKNDRPYVYGAPWSGKTNLNSNVCTPLKAIVFLGRAESNSIRKIGTAEAFCYLNDQTFPAFYDTELFNRNIEILEKLIKTVPVYKLDCNMEDSAAILSRDTIFNK